jgi:tetratricopeptide (TPR) repeat protein
MMTSTDYSSHVRRQARRGRVSVRLLVGLAAILAVLVVGGGYAWYRFSAPEPPVIAMGEGTEPAVVKAVEEAREQVRSAPRSGAAWGKLGQVLLANGFSDESEVCFVQAERFEPEEPRWPYLRASRLILRDREAALPSLRRAVELCERKDRNNTTPRLMLAEVYLEKNEWDQVESHCRRVLERQPENSRAHFDLGMVALAHDDLVTAVEQLTQATSSPYTQKRARIELAAVYQRLGNKTALEENARALQNLIDDHPWPDPYADEYQKFVAGRQSRFLQAERLDHEGRLPEEIEVLQGLARDFPDERSLLALGTAQAKMGDDEGAEQSLTAALRLAPDWASTHYALAVAQYRLGERLRERKDAHADEKFRSAANEARRATELKSDHAMAYHFLGLALARLGRRAEAIDSFRTGTRCRPEVAEIHLMLGKTLAEDGKTDEALVQLQYARDLSPPDDTRAQQEMDRVRAGHP